MYVWWDPLDFFYISKICNFTQFRYLFDCNKNISLKTINSCFYYILLSLTFFLLVRPLRKTIFSEKNFSRSQNFLRNISSGASPNIGHFNKGFNFILTCNPNLLFAAHWGLSKSNVNSFAPQSQLLKCHILRNVSPATRMTSELRWNVLKYIHMYVWKDGKGFMCALYEILRALRRQLTKTNELKE